MLPIYSNLKLIKLTWFESNLIVFDSNIYNFSYLIKISKFKLQACFKLIYVECQDLVTKALHKFRKLISWSLTAIVPISSQPTVLDAFWRIGSALFWLVEATVSFCRYQLQLMWHTKRPTRISSRTTTAYIIRLNGNLTQHLKQYAQDGKLTAELVHISMYKTDLDDDDLQSDIKR